MHEMNRRFFLGTLTAALTAPKLGLPAARGKPLLSFSTLGCPEWDWKTILRSAAQWGFSGIELRGIQKEMDLTKRPEFAAARLPQTLAELQEKNLKITDLGSSAQMHHQDPVSRAKQLDEGKRFIDLAHSLKTPYVRVFGDKYVEGEPKEKSIERIVAGLKELGTHAKGSGVSVLMESHGDFYDSKVLKQILDAVNLPNVAFLWDAHHTVVAGKESPEQTYQAVGRYVRHVHLKDSVPKGADHQYVLTGKGEARVKETVQVLAQHGYQGYYNLEWEKTWIPELEEPEVVFPHFAQVMKEYLASVGSR